MNENRRITNKRLIAYVSVISPSVFAVALGCLCLFNNVIISKVFVITYLLIPIIAAALLALIVFSNINVIAKTLLSIVVLVVFVLSFLVFRVLGTFEFLEYEKGADIGENYTEVCNRFGSMPTPGELGDYTDVEYYDYFASGFLIFSWSADTLLVSYDTEEYEEQKALLDEKYVFWEEGRKEGGHWCPSSVEIDGYLFRVVDLNGEDTPDYYYPKRMVCIATNDEKKTIAYTAYRDEDLDYINSLKRFLVDDCGWKYILER